MRNIEYEIKLNDDGKPYIHLENYNPDLEDRFFCVEIARYIIFDIIKETDTLDDEVKKEIMIGGEMINGLANRLGDMIIERDAAMDDVEDILKPNDD